ncbi:ABC transporter permease [Vagococcus xieshaowenii]|uniref:ABC transporter permease n=1 Tax=Vagococcus xieshaowenii TaxID=2562451 RepID=A0AAJ5JLU2_9ENTE|nr:ABC transporter permease [Vagococcus xieshaowenii]QCA29038.1 ABC transporter permease [Vagococcus xieshaowenii]TFZ40986.1 ABC transporter permease [Vagococcus xieshaowenii]
MAELFQLRLSRYQKKIFRYLKYVFNDHMSLLLLFMVGGFVFYYTEFIKIISDHPVVLKLLVSLIWLASLSVGHIATLVEEADKVFLLPKEKEIRHYLARAFNHSLGVPFVVVTVVTFLCGPLLLTNQTSHWLTLLPLLLMMYVLKWTHLTIKQTQLYQLTEEEHRRLPLLYWLIAGVTIVTSLFINGWIGLVMAVAMAFLIRKKNHTTLTSGIFDWDQAIKTENSRQKKIYQFINLFTDVPGIKSQVKRRSYFDSLIKVATKNDKNPYVYLFARSFVRGNEYSGMFIRLLLVAIVMLCFASSLYMALPISLVAIFLIGFQLIPMFQQFDYMVMTQLYPLEDRQKQKGLQKVITMLLLLAAFVLSVLLAIVVAGAMNKLIAIAITFVFTLALTSLYIPFRLKK